MAISRHKLVYVNSFSGTLETLRALLRPLFLLVLFGTCGQAWVLSQSSFDDDALSWTLVVAAAAVTIAYGIFRVRSGKAPFALNLAPEDYGDTDDWKVPDPDRPRTLGQWWAAINIVAIIWYLIAIHGAVSLGTRPDWVLDLSPGNITAGIVGITGVQLVSKIRYLWTLPRKDHAATTELSGESAR